MLERQYGPMGVSVSQRSKRGKRREGNPPLESLLSSVILDLALHCPQRAHFQSHLQHYHL